MLEAANCLFRTSVPAQNSGFCKGSRTGSIEGSFQGSTKSSLSWDGLLPDWLEGLGLETHRKKTSQLSIQPQRKGYEQCVFGFPYCAEPNILKLGEG